MKAAVAQTTLPIRATPSPRPARTATRGPTMPIVHHAHGSIPAAQVVPAQITPPAKANRSPRAILAALALPPSSLLERLAALKTSATPNLKAQWRSLFGTEPPPYNRRFLENRLAYRIQELEHGGLSHSTTTRLRALAEQVDGDAGSKGRRRGGKAGERLAGRRRPASALPVAGTKLIREWQGVEHVVTVTGGGFEWQGRPYTSLSALAFAISGTKWNGWAFFGLGKPGRS